MTSAAVDIRELAHQIVGAVPRFDPASRRVAVGLYRLLAEGRPVPLGRLAKTLDLSDETIRQILSDYSVFYDEQGDVIGFGGLTVAEMPPHRFRVDGRTLYTWCAWDSLFIPGILGTTAEVTSLDPLTRAPIALTVAPHRVTHVSPETTAISFLTPDLKFDRDVIANFCHYIHFFSSPQAGNQWTAKHPGTFLLSLEDAFALGQLTNAQYFGDALRAPASAEP